MTFIDIAIPGIIGLVLLLSPQYFLRNSTSRDQNKIRILKKSGIVLLVVAGLYLVIAFFNK